MTKQIKNEWIKILLSPDGMFATELNIPHIPGFEIFDLFFLLSNAMRFFFAKIISMVCINFLSVFRISLCDTGRIKYFMLVYG